MISTLVSLHSKGTATSKIRFVWVGPSTILVVCDNGINVDGGRTIQFVLKLMLNVVNLIVDNQQISVGGNLSVEGKN